MLWENGINGILADEMGLGKTIQCIAHVAMMVEKKVLGPFLVVAPLSTLPNWISEFKRFTPEVAYVLLFFLLNSHTRITPLSDHMLTMVVTARFVLQTFILETL